MTRKISTRPVLSIVSLMFLFVLAEIVSEVASQGVGPGSGPTAVVVKLGVFALFIFVAVPILLGLPTGASTVRSFPSDVGLTRLSPAGRNLLLLVAIYLTFALSQLAGQWIHQWTHGVPVLVDFGRSDLLGARTLTSGIFEEIVMRGVMLTYLLTRYSRGRSVLVSAAVFAAIHLLNLLNPASNPVWVLAQTTWAFAFGVMYAEVFIRTRSLYVPILIHLLVNGTVSVWFHGLGDQSLTSALLGIPFFGVVPAFLGILWVRWLRGDE